MQLVCAHCGIKNRVPSERLKEQPVCGRCGAALMRAEPVALDDTLMQRFVEGTELPVLVDFWAAWCGPCHQMAPHFAAAAAQVPEVRFVKVDTDEAPQSAARYRIRSIPTLVLLRGGAEVARQSGAMTRRDLLAWLRQHLG